MTTRGMFRVLGLGFLTQLGLLSFSCSSDDSTGSGGSGATAPGCTQPPNCGTCRDCLDGCLCRGGNAQACQTQCAAGTGGSSGTGGTGGSTGGTGGSTGGTGGSTATGGTGGSTGGTGGSTGGTGGSTGGSGGTGPGQCVAQNQGITCQNIDTGVPACNTCMQASCCSQVNSCFADLYCAGLQECANLNCAGITDPNEFGACIQANCSACVNSQATVDLFNAIPTCLEMLCPTECQA